MQQELRFPCSPDQEEIIADYLLFGAELGIPPDEREWMRAKVAKDHAGWAILSGDLDLENAEWVVQIVKHK